MTNLSPDLPRRKLPLVPKASYAEGGHHHTFRVPSHGYLEGLELHFRELVPNMDVSRPIEVVLSIYAPMEPGIYLSDLVRDDVQVSGFAVVRDVKLPDSADLLRHAIALKGELHHPDRCSTCDGIRAAVKW